jgi:hypothetical protein
MVWTVAVTAGSPALAASGPGLLGKVEIVDGSPYPHAWGVLDSDRLMHPVDVSNWPVRIDNRRQLFVDDYLIAERRGVRRVLHQVKKHPSNPIMLGETAWEGGPAYGPVLAYVLHDDSSHRFRLWYRSRVEYTVRGHRFLWPNLYAESADGLHWERPSLGLYEFDGSRDNNIILPAGDLRGLIHEPHDAAAPWKAVWEAYGDPHRADGMEEQGLYLYTSPDGIRWTLRRQIIPYGPRYSGDLPLTRLGDTNHFRWDPLLGKYVCDTRGIVRDVLGKDAYRPSAADGTLLPVPGGGDTNHRLRLQMESDDLIHWSRPRVVAFPDQVDWASGAIGFYGLLGTVYESMWLGYLRVYRQDPWKRVDVQLMTSRDGRTWSRACDRETFLPLGPEGSWEADYSEINHAGPLLVDDELWFFYRGTVLERHRGTGPDLRKAMGLATLRRDGFASLAPEGERGSVTTRPLTFSGRRLYVNAAVEPGGSIRVSALARDGQPLDGLSATDCLPVVGDTTAIEVAWQGDGLGGLSAESVRLQFDLDRAHLYGFWLE